MLHTTDGYKVKNYWDFEDRQKCGKPIYIRGRWLFENAAQSDINGMVPKGYAYRLTSPPDDELELLKLKIEFLEFQLEEETRNFNELKAAALQQGSTNESVIVDLKQGRERIVKLRDKIKSLKDRHAALFAQTPEEIRRRENEAMLAKSRLIVAKRQERVRKEAQAIKI